MCQTLTVERDMLKTELNTMRQRVEHIQIENTQLQGKNTNL